MTTAASPAMQSMELGSAQDSLVTRILQRYPVTFLMTVPYLVLILPQALFYGNPRILLLLLLGALGLCGAGVIETLFLLLRSPYSGIKERMAVNSTYPQILRVAQPVAVIGIVADLISAAAGGGAIDTQVTGRAASSPLVSLMTPLSGWKYLALALFTSACLGGLMVRRKLYLWAVTMMIVQLIVTSYTATTAPMVSFFSFLALASLMFGLIRIRIVLALAVGLLLLWPSIFAIRNEIRHSKGIDVSADVTAQERLRFDEQISDVASYQVPARLPGLIGPGEIVRYGLIPRVLDSSRPILATGGLVSDYIGGSRINSYSFLPLGNLYFLTGPYGVVVFYGAWALVLVLLLRTGRGPGPVRLMLLFGAIAGPLSWTNSYPESLVGYLQSAVSMIPVVLALRIFGADAVGGVLKGSEKINNPAS